MSRVFLIIKDRAQLNKVIPKKKSEGCVDTLSFFKSTLVSCFTSLFDFGLH